MRKTILAATVAGIAFAAGTATAGDANYRAIHNLAAPGQATIHKQVIPPPANGKSDFAVVNADGTIARGRNVLSVDHNSTGVYIVHFTKKKTGCAFLATVGLGGSSGTSAPGYATVVGAAVDPNAVFLDTYGSNGSVADLGFHLITSC